MCMAARLRMRSDEKETRRTSVSLPSELHRQLEQIAKLKKVSLAWVIRDAAEVYVEDKSPLPMKKR
jgi:metal-responsive CopG/Arc/MetJ family transcriptional regulator